MMRKTEWKEREEENGHGPGAIKIIGTFLDGEGLTRESDLGYVEPEISTALTGQDVEKLWGRIRCIRPPGTLRKPTFCLRFDLLVELDDNLFDDEAGAEHRPEDLLPASS